MDVAEWLGAIRAGARRSAKVDLVLDVIAAQPRLASYGSTAEIADRAGVNSATVVRAAQALGYVGWLDFRQDIRSRYLTSLTALEVGATRAGELVDVSNVVHVALRQDAQNLGIVMQSINRESVEHFAEAIADSDRTLVVSGGSYDAVSLVLAHLGTVMGYPITLEMRGGPHLANALQKLGPGSCFVAIAFWRLHDQTMRAAQVAARSGATVCVITDSSTNPLAAVADHLVVVPSESSDWFPSLTCAISVANAVLTVLAQLPGSNAKQSLAQMENIWNDMDLYH